MIQIIIGITIMMMEGMMEIAHTVAAVAVVVVVVAVVD